MKYNTKLSMHRLVNKKDIWLILAILSVSGSLFWYGKIKQSPQHLSAEVFLADNKVMTLPLDRDHAGIVQIEGTGVQLEVAEQAIRFLHSDCPDQICIHSGWLNRTGNVAACLPNEIIVRVVSDSDLSTEQESPDVVIGR